MSTAKCVFPGGHASRAFTATQVARMRDAIADGVSLTEVGARFGCSPDKVKALVRAQRASQ